MRTREIVVGTDGSANSQFALRWAAREARRRGVPLRVLFVYDWTLGGRRIAGDAYRAAAEAEAARIVDAAVAITREEVPEVDVSGESVVGTPVWRLVAASRKAELVVVGSRGHGGFSSLMLGAVSQRLATHAACPVVVVRGRTHDHDGPVVVGVDGSPTSSEALGMAFAMAAARGCPLVALTAYTPPNPAWTAEIGPAEYLRAEIEAETRKCLEQDLTPWRDKYPDVAVDVHAVAGGAAHALIRLSHGAQLVAAGSRGHGDVAGTLLGSVGLQLLHHADCPVLIVRPHPAPEAIDSPAEQ